MPHKRACHWSPAVRGNWSFAQLWRYRFSPHGAFSSSINCIPFGPNTCFMFSLFFHIFIAGIISWRKIWNFSVQFWKILTWRRHSLQTYLRTKGKQKGKLGNGEKSYEEIHGPFCHKERWLCIIHEISLFQLHAPEFERKSESLSVMSDSLQPRGLYSPWDSPWISGQNTGVGNPFLLRGSSQPRDRTQVSRIVGRFFTTWATKEAPPGINKYQFIDWII